MKKLFTKGRIALLVIFSVLIIDQIIKIWIKTHMYWHESIRVTDWFYAYLSKFNFAGADQEKLCGVLSGGERNRLHLALTLKAEANVLLLDEPTNDIDVNTLRALEEGLENFAGCAVVVSHDRWFLDRICTHILSFEGDSNVVFYEGSYSEYEEYKRKLLGDVEPKRVRYRKLIVD